MENMYGGDLAAQYSGLTSNHAPRLYWRRKVGRFVKRKKNIPCTIYKTEGEDLAIVMQSRCYIIGATPNAFLYRCSGSTKRTFGLCTGTLRHDPSPRKWVDAPNNYVFMAATYADYRRWYRLISDVVRLWHTAPA